MRLHIQRLSTAAAALAAVCFLTNSLPAQGERATLTGTVNDPSGSPIAGAEIAATHRATGVRTATVTTTTGVFRLPYLPIGVYEVTAAAKGMATAVFRDVEVRLGQTLTLDFNLALAQLVEQVTVAGDAPIVETGTAQVSRYMSNKELEKAPILIDDSRRTLNWIVFTALPGAWGTSTLGGTINGGQLFSSETLIEGIPSGRSRVNGDTSMFSVEAVGEIKTESGVMGAQFNGTQTGLASVAIRSGTNQLHGSVYLTESNEALNANSWLNNASGLTRGVARNHNYGFTAGGPIWIPKLYRGTNRSFFFLNYEHSRQRDIQAAGRITLPAAPYKNGDFSRLLDPAWTGNPRSGASTGADILGRPVVFGQIFDPASTRVVNGQRVRDPFPGNTVPKGRWSRVSSRILELAPIPDPNLDTMLDNTYGTPSTPERNPTTWSFKLDHNFNPLHRLSFFFNEALGANYQQGQWGLPPGGATNTWRYSDSPSYAARMAYDWAVSPTVLNRLSLGYNRYVSRLVSAVYNQGWPEKIGLQNVPQTTFPTLTFSGHPGYQGGGIAGGTLGSGVIQGQFEGSTIVQEDFTVIRGSHTFKAGVDVRRYYFNNIAESAAPAFAFSPVQTEAPGFSASTGHSFASFLLGAAHTTGRTENAGTFGYRTGVYGVYFQDDWKVTRRLTVNLGLRWEVITPYNEVHGRVSDVDFGVANPRAGDLRGALVFAERMNRKGFQDTYWKMLAPRAGFAYSVSPKLVIRGGYGINNVPNIFNSYRTLSMAGYSGVVDLNRNNTALRFPDDPVLNWDNPYPGFSGTLPSTDPSQANGQAATHTARNSARVPYTQNFNLAIQRALGSNMSLEVGYVGNKGTRLRSQGMDNLNQLPASFLSLGDTLLDQMSAHPELGPLPFAGFRGTVAQALRPYPQYGNITQPFPYSGTSLYNSLQVVFTRRFSRGLAINGSYVWQKALFKGSDNAPNRNGPALAAQDVYNRGLERSIAFFSFPQMFKTSWIWDIPAGKGSRLGAGRVLNAIVGGWSLSALHTYRSGNPLAITANGLREVLFNENFRPDLVLGTPVVLNADAPIGIDGKGPRYLNPAAFQMPPVTRSNIPSRPGTVGRFLPNVRGPRFFYEYASLAKSFSAGEKVRVTLRADAFNPFNRVERGDPITEITDPRFGAITQPGFGGPTRGQTGARSVVLGARIVF